MKQRQLLSLFSLPLLFVGCATENGAPPARDDRFHTVVEQCVVDDPQPVFQKAFPNGFPIRKDNLETNAEYSERLNRVGVTGMTVTYLVSGESCDVIAMPEQGTYVVTSKETAPVNRGYYATDEIGKEFGLTLRRINTHSGSFVGQNAYGATAQVTSDSYNTYRLKITNLDVYTELKWKKDDQDSWYAFGVPYRTTDPAFRQALRDKKVGFVVRGPIGDIRDADEAYRGHTATITEPYSYSDEILMLPLAVTDVWLVNCDTLKSYVHWTPAIVAIRNQVPAVAAPAVQSEQKAPPVTPETAKPATPVFKGDRNIYIDHYAACGNGFGFWVKPMLKGMRLNVYVNDNKPTTFTVGSPDASLDIDNQKAGSAQYTSQGHTYVIEWDNSKKMTAYVSVTVWVLN